ncbi:putative NADH dehydrogenase [ubiquinone] 1 alpha subcomplex subunit 5, mitochondrial [Iris pallida]|uniref:NADH dehydrogenase [ubiquinone] 1 alpha subcomplex subunit 5, mitochondrial n=1 Tax=Iris pallida TaxID=29817 RepID=A0AAX6DIM6_IRIPA|nr:putative NADH dehydrogenase [ubiquinone] 1 alpha subcomplex subunit 5, mitochondrial [Iris pallida]
MFLRRMLSPAMAGSLMARVKETTGIVGLDVVPNAREVLISLYTRTLGEIKAVPEDEGYRKAVESFTSHRLKVCREEEDWEAIEKRIGCGQVEELIEEAQDELKLIAKMIEWDPGVFQKILNVRSSRTTLQFLSTFLIIALPTP